MGISTKDWIKGLITKQEKINFETVKIDFNEFDSNSISSSFLYAVSKYGVSICKEPDKLKNILSDLAPNLSKETKLLQYLCKSGNLDRLLNLCDKEDSELLFWMNNAVSHLVSNEMIDEKLAYEFCNNLVYDVAGRDMTDAFLKHRKEEAQEQELKKMLNRIKVLIEEEKFETVEESLHEICKKTKKQEVVEEAEQLLKLVNERQLEVAINYITTAIDEGRYKDGSNHLEVAKKILEKCGNSKKIKDIVNQIAENEKKLEEVIQKCLKNADKAIKGKEYDKADIFIEQAKDVAGNYFQIDNTYSFWKTRALVEQQIDDREFEKATNNINNLQQSVGLEKEFDKYISAMERRIHWYQKFVLLFKWIFLLVFAAILVVTNIKIIVSFQKIIIHIISALWLIIAVFVMRKLKRKTAVLSSTLLLIFNYAVWLGILYFLNHAVDMIGMVVFAILFPLASGLLLLKTAKSIKYGRIVLGNLGIAVLLTGLVIGVQYYQKRNYDDAQIETTAENAGKSNLEGSIENIVNNNIEESVNDNVGENSLSNHTVAYDEDVANSNIINDGQNTSSSYDGYLVEPDIFFELLNCYDQLDIYEIYAYLKVKEENCDTLSKYYSADDYFEDYIRYDATFYGLSGYVVCSNRIMNSRYGNAYPEMDIYWYPYQEADANLVFYYLQDDRKYAQKNTGIENEYLFESENGKIYYNTSLAMPYVSFSIEDNNVSDGAFIDENKIENLCAEFCDLGCVYTWNYIKSGNFSEYIFDFSEEWARKEALRYNMGIKAGENQNSVSNRLFGMETAYVDDVIWGDWGTSWPELRNYVIYSMEDGRFAVNADYYMVSDFEAPYEMYLGSVAFNIRSSEISSYGYVVDEMVIQN